MNELMVFQYGQNEVRTVTIESEPWWVLKDVCNVLGLDSPHKVGNRLDEDERNQIPLIDSLGRQQKTTIINESGLYAVILRSDKPRAKPFRKWVTSEVLPTIRKTGAYNPNNGPTLEQRIQMANIITRSTKHTLPYVLEVLQVKHSPIENVTLTENQEVDANIADFIDFHGSVIGQSASEVYDKYCDYCRNRGIENTNRRGFSVRLCKYINCTTKVLRIDRKAQRVFTEK